MDFQNRWILKEMYHFYRFWGPFGPHHGLLRVNVMRTSQGQKWSARLVKVPVSVDFDYVHQRCHLGHSIHKQSMSILPGCWSLSVSNSANGHTFFLNSTADLRKNLFPLQTGIVDSKNRWEEINTILNKHKFVPLNILQMFNLTANKYRNLPSFVSFQLVYLGRHYNPVKGLLVPGRQIIRG